MIIETTTEPTLLPTVTEPITTETIPPIGGDKGWIDVYCNVDGASVYFDGVSEGTISGGILSVAVSTTSSPISTDHRLHGWIRQLVRQPLAHAHAG